MKEYIKSEKGAIATSLITLFAILIAAIVVYAYPLVLQSKNNDNQTLQEIQKLTDEFISNITTTGLLTQVKIDSLEQELNATGNSYEIKFEIKKLAENVEKTKGQYLEVDSIGENKYYSEYTSSILEYLNNDELKPYILYEGEIITINVRNTNTTLGQILSNFFYTVMGSNEGLISTTSSGMVTKNGGNKVVD